MMHPSWKKGPGAKGTQSPVDNKWHCLPIFCWHFCLKVGEVIQSWHHSDNSILQGKIQIWLCQKIRVTVLHLQHHWSKDIYLRFDWSFRAFRQQWIWTDQMLLHTELVTLGTSAGGFLLLQVAFAFMLRCRHFSCGKIVIKKNSWHPTAWKTPYTKKMVQAVSWIQHLSNFCLKFCGSFIPIHLLIDHCSRTCYAYQENYLVELISLISLISPMLPYWTVIHLSPLKICLSWSPVRPEELHPILALRIEGDNASRDRLLVLAMPTAFP